MTRESSSSPIDPETLADSIRALAIEAHRLLGRPDADPRALHALTRRIAALRRQVPGGPPGELACWLASLRWRLEARHRAACAITVA